MASSSSLARHYPLKTLLAPSSLLRTLTSSSSSSAPSHGVDELICEMMAKRPWTTRLENSIRAVLPSTPPDDALVLSVLCKARSPHHALNFFRLAERKASFRHTPATRLLMIRILSDHSLLNHARCILLAPSAPLDEPMFLPLIRAYASARIPQESVKLFRLMPSLGVPRSLASYEVFLKAILSRGRAFMAKRVFNAMLRDDSVSPTLYTYNIMIWGFCLSHMMSTATRFLREMSDRGLRPDVVTYNTLLGGWVRVGDTAAARQVFEEMRQLGLLPNDITYNTLLKGCLQEGDAGEALRLFHEMTEAGVPPTDKTFNTLLPSLSRDAGFSGEARRLLETMAERHIRPKEDGVFLDLVSCLCDAGRPEEGVEILRLADRFRMKLDFAAHYGKLIEGFCRAGSFVNAIEMVGEVLERGVLSTPGGSVFSPEAYVPVIAHMCGIGMTGKAETFFRLLMKKGVDDATAFNHLIRGHSVEGSPELGLELLTIMSKRSVVPDVEATASLVESFIRKGDLTDTKVAFDAMMEHGHLPSSSLFRSVMESLFNNDRVQTASRVMQSMIEKGVKENMDVVHKILEALLLRGHVEEALGRIKLLMDNQCIPEIDRLLNILCDKDKFNAALKLADFGLERDCDISFESYDRVLDALSANGKTLNAYSLLCKIKNKGGHTNKKAAAALVKNLIDEGNTKQADILSRLLFPKERKGRNVTASAV